MKYLISLLFIVLVNITGLGQTYTMPHESETHEGTWLQWPHQYEYGFLYRNSLDATWVAMTKALVNSEKVHIVAYNNTEKNRIISLLNTANVPLANVDFFIFPTNDVWIRDNGPIFVRDSNGNLLIEDWGFNGWGGKFNYDLCNPIPESIGSAIDMQVVDLNSVMVNEGGAVELDGNGVLMACKSSILSQSPPNTVRNPGMTQSQAESIFSQYLGVSKFIWLDGNVGDPDDVTDFHIDGFAKYLNNDTLVTMNNSDLVYWGVSSADIAVLYDASNMNNIVYEKVYLPLTQNNVETTSGNNLGYKGSYVNYYVANNVVLVPNYNDPNDAVANDIIQSLYPNRTVEGIDCRNLYEWGGMVHCVTQQQPSDSALNCLHNNSKESIEVGQNVPNPFSEKTTIEISLAENSSIQLIIYNSFGQIVSNPINLYYSKGNHLLTINASNLRDGIYNYQVIVNEQKSVCKKMVVAK
jgi:agmatine deiminase